MTVDDIIEKFKENESAENIVPLVESEELRNGLVAWKSVVVTRKGENNTCDDDLSEAEMWQFIWEDVDFGLSSFGVVAGVQNQHVQRLFNRLKGLRLIYPDGSIHKIAAQYLQSLILAKLPKPKKS